MDHEEYDLEETRLMNERFKANPLAFVVYRLVSALFWIFIVLIMAQCSCDCILP